MRGTAREVGEAYATRPAAESGELNFADQAGIQEETELEWMDGWMVLKSF